MGGRRIAHMNRYPTHFDTPEDAYFGFFEADAAQDGDAWGAVMSYPHVRVAASGEVLYFETARDYADAADWTSRVATGWVRTRGREPVRLHESADRVLLLGGWTRFNSDDEPILWNRVTYILTRLGDSWGIQARFALGSLRRRRRRSARQPGRRGGNRSGRALLRCTGQTATATPAPDSAGFQ